MALRVKYLGQSTHRILNGVRIHFEIPSVIFKAGQIQMGKGEPEIGTYVKEMSSYAVCTVLFIRDFIGSNPLHLRYFLEKRP